MAAFLPRIGRHALANLLSLIRARANVLGLVAVSLLAARSRALPPLPDDFINDDLIVLAVFDLAQATPSAIDATGRGIIEHIPEFGDIFARLRDDHEPFVNAGGRFVVIAAAESPSEDLYAFMPIAGVFVDGEHCDEATLTAIIKKHAAEVVQEPVVERHGDWLLLWKSDRLRLINRKEDGPLLDIPGMNPHRGDLLRAAFAALDGRAVGAMMMPTAKMHKEAEEQFADFPPEMADSPFDITMTIAAAVSMHGWIDLGHNPSVTGVVEMPDAPLASKLSSQVRALPAFIKEQMADMGDMPPEMLEEMGPEVKLMTRIITSISCFQQGSTVTISIGQANLREILDLAAPIIEEDQKRAKEWEATANSRQLGMAVITYAHGHDNQWPATLDDLVDKGQITREELDDMLTNPTTGEKMAYKYVKPGKPMGQIENPSIVAMIYEIRNGSIYKDGVTCYADGHVMSGANN